MKRTVLTLITLLLALSLIQPVCALKIGDVVGQVLYTDIVAKIDGHPIRAFNVANHMCVVAEDLRAYGFDVVWYADERMLTVAPSKTVNPASFPEYVPEPPKGKIGAPAFPILYTDIVTYVDGREVESFNIDGQTVIYFQDLRKSGVVHYDNAVRTTFYTRGDAWSVSAERENTGYPRGATGSSLRAEVVMKENGASLSILSDPGWKYMLEVTQSGFTVEEAGSLQPYDPLWGTAYWKAVQALQNMDLPNMADTPGRTGNTPEQRAAVSDYIRVTLNGDPLPGDCWFGWGAGHLDLHFDFDRAVMPGTGEVLTIEIGGSGEAGELPNSRVRDRDLPWQEKLEEIRNGYFVYREYWRAETEKYLVLNYALLTGRPGNVGFTIFYKDGGWDDVAWQLPDVFDDLADGARPGRKLVPADDTVPAEEQVFFTLSEDGEYVYFMAEQVNSGTLETYRVILAEGRVERLR